MQFDCLVEEYVSLQTNQTKKIGGEKLRTHVYVNKAFGLA